MTAPGHTNPPRVADLLGAIGVLTDGPTPRGHERSTAAALAEWARNRWPDLYFSVDEIGSAGGNLVCSTAAPSPDDLLIYSHLDTSLTGIGVQDHGVTGSWDDAEAGFRVCDNNVSAFGLGVARGPAAAALVGFASAAASLPQTTHRSLRLVLAGGGTHENSIPDPPGPESLYCGLETHLDQYPLPGAAVVAKAGPRGILWDEPGAGYLRIRVSGRRGAVLMRDRADPPGGLPTHVGGICAAVETWREQWRSSALPIGQSGREAGIGAIRTGSTRKPDLLPSYVDLYVYVVMLPGDSIVDIAEDLRRSLLNAFHDSPLARCDVSVDGSTPQNAGITAPESEVVQMARAAWSRRNEEGLPVLSRWTGSTDGALLRSRGIDTIRTGPTSVTDDRNPEWDVISVAELLRFTHIYSEIGADWAAGVGRGR
ncbi:hypothetical protein [Rhodococcus sp. IEGM 1379]|uniref:hypothetical protein n=1 Tax=Rhodococcus sp. IEGM 1379 TaxID=3047086 RepID=UPI0024B82EC7|nr:hypothetical protein [Rhodococcus sp. IEGM 1379]MDI9917679.1 hypothetical protein [Rhodococcus sp. IEGM 1379]